MAEENEIKTVPQTGLKFGITTETKITTDVPFVPTWQNPFPIGKLINVESVHEYETQNGKLNILQFTVRSLDNLRIYRHNEFEPMDNVKVQATIQEQLLNLDSRVGHIYSQFQTIPKEGIGNGAKNCVEYFDLIANAFNKGGKDNKPIYKLNETDWVKVWLKLVYILNDKKGYLRFPYRPHFIERFVDGVTVPKTLTINKKYETLDQPTPSRRKADGIGEVPTGSPDTTNYPDF